MLSYLALWRMTPRVNPSIFFTGHTMAPSGVDHTVCLRGQFMNLVIQANVTKTFLTDISHDHLV